MKRAITASLFLVLLLSPTAHAVMATDVGNAACPVSGDKVSGKDFVEQGGKKYGLCCPMCAAKINKNPEKYLTKDGEVKESHDHSM